MQHDRMNAHIGVVAALAATCVLIAGCGSTATGVTARGAIFAVGAENQYANVIAQVGGRYVKVSAIESNPNTDPHSFEASPSVAETVAAARLIVQHVHGKDRVRLRGGGIQLQAQGH
jgi:zinc/manganese transport system substrate-binding protein